MGILLKELFLEPVSDIDQGRFMVTPVDEYPLRINEFVQQQQQEALEIKQTPQMYFVSIYCKMHAFMCFDEFFA